MDLVTSCDSASLAFASIDRPKVVEYERSNSHLAQAALPLRVSLVS